MLQIGSLETVYPSTPCIERLGNLVGVRGRSRGRGLVILNGGSVRHDGVHEVLVKVPSLDDSKRIQVMLNQDVDVVCHLRSEVGITERNGIVWIAGSNEHVGHRLSDVLRVGS